MDFRKALIYTQKKYAGILKESDDGYTFQYDKDYIQSEDAIPISLTLPISEKEYKSNILFPFFDGLIPEGWLLDIAIKNWKLDRRDRFGIMLAVCKDSIGDVEIIEVV